MNLKYCRQKEVHKSPTLKHKNLSHKHVTNYQYIYKCLYPTKRKKIIPFQNAVGIWLKISLKLTFAASSRAETVT